MLILSLNTLQLPGNITFWKQDPVMHNLLGCVHSTEQIFFGTNELYRIGL